MSLWSRKVHKLIRFQKIHISLLYLRAKVKTFSFSEFPFQYFFSMESVKESEFMKSPLPIKIHININFEKSLFPENEFQTAFGKTVKKPLPPRSPSLVAVFRYCKVWGNVVPTCLIINSSL